jgi:ABC-type dipeptide/oligopeptide/nickel transport system permease subunit
MRPLDLGFAGVWGILLLAAAWGMQRAPQLFSPPVGAADERVHAALALLAWPLAAFGLFRFLRRPAAPAQASAWSDLQRQLWKSPTAVFGLYAAITLGLLALMAPLLTAHDWMAVDVEHAREAPSLAHPFGTDDYGRDLWARCLYGGRVSLVVGFVSVTLSATLGTLVGASAGYFGGLVDKALMGFTDLLLALPRLVLLLAVLGMFRLQGADRLFFIVAVLGLTGWMGVARIVRAQVLSLKAQEFVDAARSLGLPTWRILSRHVVPNALAPVIVHASLALGGTILTEAALSFLGLGVSPPTPTWGVIVNEGKELMRSAPWVMVFPGLLICAAVMSFNLLGDGLRDALDPRLRGRSG